MDDIEFAKLRHKNHNKILSLSTYSNTIYLKATDPDDISEMVYFDERGFLTNKNKVIKNWAFLDCYKIETDLEKL